MPKPWERSYDAASAEAQNGAGGSLPWQRNYEESPKATPPPTATISQGEPEPWLDQLEQDIKQGGNRTLPGRILGRMQGRGDKGYSGLESGVSKDAASFMGSPEEGAIEWLKGLNEMRHHPVSGDIHALEGLGHAAEIPLAFAGGPEADAAIEAIPSRAHAGKVFKSIEETARNTPVHAENTASAMRDFDTWIERAGNGGERNPVMSKLGKRIENLPPRPRLAPTAVSRADRLLGGGIEETPLHRSPDVEGTLSRPVTLHQPDRAAGLRLAAPKVDTPLTEHPWYRGTSTPPDEGLGAAEPNLSRVGEPFVTPEGNPNYGYSDQFPSAEGKWTGGVVRRAFEGVPAEGMGHGEYIGEIPGERGGSGQVQGVLRRPRVFGQVQSPSPEPNYAPAFNFPEARDFYENVSRETARPGFLRRAFEPSSAPAFRMRAGDVRQALNADLADAATRAGRGGDYANAMKEYRRAAKLNRAAKIGGAIAAGEGLRRSGLLGKVTSGVMNATR